MSITYARFNDLARARLAAGHLRRRVGVGARVDVLCSVGGLSHHSIPLRMTAARNGTIYGGVAVGLVTAVTMTSLIWGLTQYGRPIPAIGETLVLALGLSMLLGALAGALAFASDNSRKCQRMRSWLRDGHPVVVINAARGHEETLRSYGAVGKIV